MAANAKFYVRVNIRLGSGFHLMVLAGENP